MKVDLLRYAITAAAAALLATAAQAQDTDWQLGPVFADFGPHAAVEGIDNFPADTEFAHSFDVAKHGEGEQRNRGIESAARFINMHAAHGVDPANMRIAVVVHGTAVLDVLTDEARTAGDYGTTNPSGDMVRAMLAQGVRFIVCGQSAAGQDITQADLIPGVEMALSAMTAHALLQQAGYSVNPF